MRGCGLKCKWLLHQCAIYNVIPHARMWIEITTLFKRYIVVTVIPHARMWIEIL